MNEVLGRWDDNEMITNDRDDASCLGRYKELRERSLNVESQAVTITADETSHKVQPHVSTALVCVTLTTKLFMIL